jgi:hypothetical protein
LCSAPRGKVPAIDPILKHGVGAPWGTYSWLMFFSFLETEVVAKFFFHVANGNELRDDAGMELNSLKEAREEALLTASELLGGDGPFWNLPVWAVRVTDEVGKDVFSVKVVMETS